MLFRFQLVVPCIKRFGVYVEQIIAYLLVFQVSLISLCLYSLSDISFQSYDVVFSSYLWSDCVAFLHGSDEAVATFLEMSGESLDELSLNHVSKVSKSMTY